jgi:hypothetical protein
LGRGDCRRSESVDPIPGRSVPGSRGLSSRPRRGRYRAIHRARWPRSRPCDLSIPDASKRSGIASRHCQASGRPIYRPGLPSRPSGPERPPSRRAACGHRARRSPVGTGIGGHDASRTSSHHPLPVRCRHGSGGQDARLPPDAWTPERRTRVRCARSKRESGRSSGRSDRRVGFRARLLPVTGQLRGRHGRSGPADRLRGRHLPSGVGHCGDDRSSAVLDIAVLLAGPMRGRGSASTGRLAFGRHARRGPPCSGHMRGGGDSFSLPLK